MRTGPTAYPELNAVLKDFVESVEATLGENFVGAYLQGSFAVGDADEHSDVDFIVATYDELSDAQVEALQGMHKGIYALESSWAQHLEGSYIPKDELRRVDESRSPYWYLDNGASELIRDNHCNTAVVRWSLRERGVVLAGPDPKSLVEPVSAAQLRREILTTMEEWVAWAHMPTNAGPMSRWLQPAIVLSYCRLLQTFETGRVTSKREAGEWALGALDSEWSNLIQRAMDTRLPGGRPGRHQRTLAFVDYAVIALDSECGAASHRRETPLPDVRPHSMDPP